MGFQQSYIKFKNENDLKEELSRLIQRKIKFRNYTSCDVVGVGRAVEPFEPFKKYEYFLVIIGERFPQKSEENLYEELGIMNIEEIVFIDDYFDLAEDEGLELSDWLDKKVVYLNDKDIQGKLEVDWTEYVKVQNEITELNK